MSLPCVSSAGLRCVGVDVNIHTDILNRKNLSLAIVATFTHLNSFHVTVGPNETAVHVTTQSKDHTISIRH